VLAAAAAGVAVFAFREKLGLPMWLIVTVAILLPALAFALARSMVHPNPRTAFAGVLLVISVAYSSWTYCRAAVRDSYAQDAVMLQKAAEIVPADAPLLVQYDVVRPLETFWVLYHTPRPGTVVRDPWEVVEKAGRREAFVLARRMDATDLAAIGTVEPVIESEKTRMELSPEFRRVLYRVTFHPVTPPPPPELLAKTRRTLW
jgi:hypothetical protein